MENNIRVLMDYVENELGGGMVGKIGLSRLNLLVGQHILEDIDDYQDDQFLIKKIVQSAEIVLGKKIPEDLLKRVIK